MKTKEKQSIEDRAQYVRRGGSLRIFTAAQVIELQEFALRIKDIRLYDYLNQFWHSV